MRTVKYMPIKPYDYPKTMQYSAMPMQVELKQSNETMCIVYNIIDFDVKRIINTLY